MPANYSIEHNHEPTQALPEGLSILKAKPLPLIMGGIAEFFTWSGLWLFLQLSLMNEFSSLGNILLWVLALLVCAFLFVVQSWVRSGYILTQNNALSNAPDTFESFYSNTLPRPFIQWRLIYFGVQIGAGLLACLPGEFLGLIGGFIESEALQIIGGALSVFLCIPALIFARMSLFFGDRLVILSHYTPKAALKQSYNLSQQNRVTILTFMMVAGATRLAGGLFCGVGLIFVDMLLDISLTKAYNTSRSSIEEATASS